MIFLLFFLLMLAVWLFSSSPCSGWVACYQTYVVLCCSCWLSGIVCTTSHSWIGRRKPASERLADVVYSAAATAVCCCSLSSWAASTCVWRLQLEANQRLMTEFPAVESSEHEIEEPFETPALTAYDY